MMIGGDDQVTIQLPAALTSSSAGAATTSGFGGSRRRRRGSSASSRRERDPHRFRLPSSSSLSSELPQHPVTDFLARASLEDLRRGDAGVQQEASTLAAALARHAPAVSAVSAVSANTTTTTRTTKTWTVGLDPDARRLHVLLPGQSDARLSARLRSEGLAETPVPEIKKLLVQNNLVRYGAGVTDDDARRFLLAIRKVGRISSTSLATQWHNATRASASAVPML